MAPTKKRRGATGAFSESQTQDHGRKDSKTRPLPDDLPLSLHGSFRQLVKAAEAHIRAGGHLYVAASWFTDGNEIGSAVFSDRDTATIAAVMSAFIEVERDRESGVQA